MVQRLIYGCGDCDHWFVFAHVCVYGTWLIFFILSAGRWTTWLDRVYLDVCFFQHKLWWSAITRNVEWSSGVKGLFLPSSRAWVGSDRPGLYVCIAKWVSANFTLCVHFNIWRICEKGREAARDKWVRPERLLFTQTPAPLHRSLIKDSLCPWAAPLSAEVPSRLFSECLPALL